MRQLCELRVNEEHAHLLFEPGEGTRLGDYVRRVVIPTDDWRFREAGRIRDRFRKEGKEAFFTGWELYYQYTPYELAHAELFHININAVFEPAGELCGTVYDETVACAKCGAGRRQVSGLVLDLRKAPKTKDMARTIAADERIITQSLAQQMMDAGLTGFELHPVHHKVRYENDAVVLEKVPSGRKLLGRAKTEQLTPDDWEFWVWLNRMEQTPLVEAARLEHADMLDRKAERKGKVLSIWYQLVVTSERMKLVPPTRTGVDPFDEDSEGKYRCPRGHVRGLNLMSEISVSRSSWDGADIALTDGFIGIRSGSLVPTQLLLVSPRLLQLLQLRNVKGYKFDVAYLV